MKLIGSSVAAMTLQKKIEVGNWLVLAVCLCLGFVFLSTPCALGILAGGCISIANFYWLSRDLAGLLQRISDNTQSNRPKRFVLLRFYSRLIVTAVVLFLVITKLPVSILGLLVGLSVVIISIIGTVIIDNVKIPLRRFKERYASPVTFR
jgi:hypothetical protein